MLRSASAQPWPDCGDAGAAGVGAGSGGVGEGGERGVPAELAPDAAAGTELPPAFPREPGPDEMTLTIQHTRPRTRDRKPPTQRHA